MTCNQRYFCWIIPAIYWILNICFKSSNFWWNSQWHSQKFSIEGTESRGAELAGGTCVLFSHRGKGPSPEIKQNGFKNDWFSWNLSGLIDLLVDGYIHNNCFLNARLLCNGEKTFRRSSHGGFNPHQPLLNTPLGIGLFYCITEYTDQRLMCFVKLLLNCLIHTCPRRRIWRCFWADLRVRNRAESFVRNRT